VATVLVIDDAKMTRRMICGALQAEGHTTYEAANGREGLDQVQAHQPTCILLDLLMPDMDGFAFLQALNELKVDTPVVVITADIQQTSVEQCLELGAIAVIHKPPSPDKVKQAINQALSFRLGRRKLRSLT
jgi:CheY-like chemotaxis protein